MSRALRSGRARPRAVALELLSAAGLAVTPAGAHEFWLEPSSFAPRRSETVTVAARSGVGFQGEARPFRGDRVVRFVAIAGRVLDLSGLGIEEDTVFARVRAPDGGGMMIAYESNAASIELPAADFDAYLEEEGLDGPLSVRRAAGLPAALGRERYARCAKTWLTGRDAGRARTACGLTLELIPRGAPSRAGTLELELRFGGAPLPGALVRAWRRPLAPGPGARAGMAPDSVGPVMRATTDARGRVRLPVAEPGEWLVSSVHMIADAEGPLAGWRSWWASLTFAR